MTPENSQIEGIRSRVSKSGNPQSRRSLNTKGNFSEERAKRGAKQKFQQKKRINSTKDKRNCLVNNSQQHKANTRISGSAKNVPTSASTTSNISRRTGGADANERNLFTKSNTRILDMLNKNMKVNSELKISLNTPSHEANKLPQIKLPSKPSEKNIIQRNKDNCKQQVEQKNKNKRTVKLLNNQSYQTKRTIDPSNFNKNLTCGNAKSSLKIKNQNSVQFNKNKVIKENKPLQKEHESSNKYYQLPIDGDSDKDNSKESNTTPSNISSDNQKKANKSAISKEKTVNNLKQENLNPSSIEMVVKNKSVLENKENFFFNNINTKSQPKENVIKQSEIVHINKAEDNKNLKIKQKSVNNTDSFEVSNNPIKVEDGDNLNYSHSSMKRASLDEIHEKNSASCSPLLTREEREYTLNFGHSLESFKVDYAIGMLDTDILLKSISYVIMKHIEFSRGEALIDDLVESDDEIPQFSYDFDEFLRIDLDEILRMKEIKQWEAEHSKIQNFDKLRYLVQGGDPELYIFNEESEEQFNPGDIYQNNINNEDDGLHNDEIHSQEFSSCENMQEFQNLLNQNSTENAKYFEKIQNSQE